MALGLRIERNRYRLSRLRLIGVNPRQLSHQVHLRPLQARHIRRPQARCQGEGGHVGQMLRQLG